MHIRIGLGFEFYFEHFWILGPNWLKKSIFDQKMKKVNSTIEFLHIQESLGTKFQLKLTIFNL